MPTRKQPWAHGLTKPVYEKLNTSKTPDVVIVGGGLAGVLSAYLIAKEGKKVVLLEKNEIGSGATSYTTAFLTQSIDTDFSDLIKAFGRKDADVIIKSHKVAIDAIEQVCLNEGIAAEFQRVSNYIYANTLEDFESLQEEAECAKALHVPAKLVKDGTKLGFPNEGYLEIENQAKFHPLKFLYAVAEAAVEHGAEIYEHTEVKDVNSDDTTVTVHANGQVITAPWGIVTTYEPFNKPLRLYFKKAFYNSYVFEVHVKGSLLQEGIYEDLANPYHYMRIEETKDGYTLLVGGEDHRQDVHVNPEKSFNALKEYLDTVMAGKEYKITKQWLGPILEPVDGIASIGPMDHENLLYAMAFSGNGMTYSMISALMFRDLVIGQPHKWHHVYAAKRLPSFKSLFTKMRDYGEEFFKGAVKNTFKQDAQPKKGRPPVK